MRNIVFLVLGILEFAVAMALTAFSWHMPSTAEVNDGFGKAERVTRQTSTQVRLVRRQIQDLRRPELRETATRLQKETRAVAGTLRNQTIDFETVAATRDALGDVASGLDSLARTLDPDTLGKLGDGLGRTASYLDEKVAPAAAEAATHLEASTAALQTDAQRLGRLLRQAPLDLKAAREIHEGMARFTEGLGQMEQSLKLQRLDAIREGFQGLETSLTTGASQIERLSGYSYPVVTFSGLKPVVEQRPFWPEGDKIAEGMRKAAAGVKEAARETERIAADLPRLRTSLEAGRKVADKTREALGTALKQQDQMERLLKDVPEHTARLAEELPRLGADLSRILRDTARLKEVAVALREAQKGLDAAASRWPELRRTLGQTAALLQVTRQQLDRALTHRDDYDAALKQTVVLADTFAEMLPWFSEHLDQQLSQQEQSLEDLGRSLDDVSDTLPVHAHSWSRMLQLVRLLLALVAVIIALHGAYLVLSVRLGRQFSI